MAVKIMYKDNMSARAAQQLRREITSMKALNHPNVLRLKDVHEVSATRSTCASDETLGAPRVGEDGLLLPTASEGNFKRGQGCG